MVIFDRYHAFKEITVNIRYIRVSLTLNLSKCFCLENGICSFTVKAPNIAHLCILTFNVGYNKKETILKKKIAAK